MEKVIRRYRIDLYTYGEILLPAYATNIYSFE